MIVGAGARWISAILEGRVETEIRRATAIGSGGTAAHYEVIGRYGRGSRWDAGVGVLTLTDVIKNVVDDLIRGATSILEDYRFLQDVIPGVVPENQPGDTSADVDALTHIGEDVVLISYRADWPVEPFYH